MRSIFVGVFSCLLSLTFVQSFAYIDISGATNLTPEEKEIANRPGPAVPERNGTPEKPRQMDVSGATNVGPPEKSPVPKTPATMFGMDHSVFNACIGKKESAQVTTYDMNCVYDKRVWKSELKKPENNLENQAMLLVYAEDGGQAPVSWSGSLQDSDLDSASIGGYGNDKIGFVCGPGGIYSLAIQLEGDNGFLGLAVIQYGKLLDLESTDQPYGMVSLAGNCAG